MATAVAGKPSIPTRAWFTWAWCENTESTTAHIVAERPYEGTADDRDGGVAGYPQGFYYEKSACGKPGGFELAFQLTESDYCRRCLAWADRHFVP